MADIFGTQVVIVSFNMSTNFQGIACSHSGRIQTDIAVTDLVKLAVESGTGKIYLNQFPVRVRCRVMLWNQSAISLRKLMFLPLIASGRAGKIEHFNEAVSAGASAVAAGSIYSSTGVTPAIARSYLSSQGIQIQSI